MSFSSAPSYPEGYQITSKLHNSLRHPARIRILRDLADGPKPAILLAANHHISSSTISEHLKFLLDLSIVSFKNRGHQAIYKFEAKNIPSWYLESLKFAWEFPNDYVDFNPDSTM